MSFGKMNFPPELQNIINSRGNLAIVGIGAGREPLAKAIAWVGNVVTMGAYQEVLKKYGYDNFVHTFLVFHLANGFTLSIEKNERIMVKFIHNATTIREGEILVQSYTPYTLRLYDFWNNVWNMYGPAILPYDLHMNNCQRFVIKCLQANGLLTPRVQGFILQDVLKEFNPRLIDAANALTKFARLAREAADNGPVVELINTIIMKGSIYINVSTNFINTPRNASTTGSKSQFNVNIPTIVLKNTNYSVTLVDARYPTVNLTGSLDTNGVAISAVRAASIFPLVQCSIVSPIIVNGQYGTLLYKALNGSDGYAYHVDREFSYGAPISVPLAQTNISNLSFTIVRSDNGDLYPFDLDTGPGPVPADLADLPVSFLIVLSPNSDDEHREFS